MRTWRVGTFSMGVALLFLGMILLYSQFIDINLTQVMIAWWPMILVVLGLEILLYLFLSRQEKPFLKYDLLSIFIVGLLGTVGIGFAILNSTGIVEKVAEVLDRKEQSFELPEYTKQLPDHVKRVVIHSERSPITIEGATGNEVSMFGTYRAATAKKEELIQQASDYVSIQEKGDTLYITLKELPEELVPFYNEGSLSATIVVPSEVKLEIFGSGNSVTIKPRMLLSDWTIDSTSNVSLYIQENSDVLVSAFGVEEWQGQKEKWTIVEDDKQSETGTELQDQEIIDEKIPATSGTYQVGKGTHHLQVINAYSITLNTLK